MEVGRSGPLLDDLILGRWSADRSAHLREPAGATALAALGRRYLLLDRQGNLAVVEERRLLFADQVAAPLLELFLGVQDATAFFAAVVDEAAAASLSAEHGCSWVSLRRVGPAFADLDSGLATSAVALANWHSVHQWCPRCGGPTQPELLGWRRLCPADSSMHFPRTDPAVIVLVQDQDGRALLGRSGRWPDGAFSTLAGFVEPGETAEAAVAREVHEEVGIVVDSLTYLGSQPWPFPASLMLGYHAAVAGSRPEVSVDGEEIVEAIWVSRDELAGLAGEGRVRLPGAISIANRLIQRWFGAPIPAQWCRW